MDVEFEEVEERVRYYGDCAIEFYSQRVRDEFERGIRGGGEGDVPSSTPYRSSNGLPVSLHIGNGIYCNSFFSFEICSPVSLYTYNQHNSSHT